MSLLRRHSVIGSAGTSEGGITYQKLTGDDFTYSMAGFSFDPVLSRLTKNAGNYTFMYARWSGAGYSFADKKEFRIRCAQAPLTIGENHQMFIQPGPSFGSSYYRLVMQGPRLEYNTVVKYTGPYYPNGSKVEWIAKDDALSCYVDDVLWWTYAEPITTDLYLVIGMRLDGEYYDNLEFYKEP